ncbi:hypothetical protein GCM10023115_04370 [Pontixanthobacter gangjinensis]|uniref:Uncharacterized protein n=1 Tax=Pontixanthobacter gangjinensis TaxID=1028742 RepID=A0A6I4SIM9_9SPHN|nr:hypothetical protein [Pontixanthobacter gangjinensis]MXO55691.1 hypothetical protein [Pontixanthobacter gangjinensis]
MRLRDLTVIAAVCGSGFALLLAWSVFGDEITDLVVPKPEETREELAAASRTLVYRLSSETPTRFAFTQPASLIRIISQPVIAPESWEERDNWTYGYRVTLKDAQGALIYNRDIFSLSLRPDKLLPYKRPVRIFRGKDKGLIALQDDAVLVSDPAASSIEISAIELGEGVQKIDVRTYERVSFIGSTALAAFRRRSPEEQANLAKANALPPEFLTNSERANLFTNRWRVLGPMGIDGRDYSVHVVYEGKAISDDGEEQ